MEILAESKWYQAVIKIHTGGKKKVSVKIITHIIIKDNIIAYISLLLTDFKHNCIKQYEYNCIVGLKNTKLRYRQ